jgi:hypothetical protein
MEPCGFVRRIRYGEGRSASRRQAVKKATRIRARRAHAEPLTIVPGAIHAADATIGRMDHRRRLGSMLLVAILVVACGSSNATPTTAPSTSTSPTSPDTSPAPSATTGTSATPGASVDANAIFDQIEQQVIQLRDLTQTAKVDREVIDATQLRDLLTTQFDKDTPPAYIKAYERSLKALGLLPPTADLRALELELLSAGVAGFYRDDQKKMYVVARSGAITATDEITYAHEFTHALQDQHWSVFADQKGVLDRTDWLMGRQAVYEGDATTLMYKWAFQYLTPEQLQSVVKDGSDPAQTAILAKMPAILSQTLLYPYTTGYAFVQSAQLSGGWPAVDAFYDRLPASSEQVMHPDLYAADDKPVDVQFSTTLAADLGTGWTVPFQDTFGEFQTAIWLSEGGAKTTASTAAAGWGGDRMAVVNGPNGEWGLAWHTVWDTEKDAQEFEAAATIAIGKAGGPAKVLPGVGGTTRWVVVGNDDATLTKLANALGLAG